MEEIKTIVPENITHLRCFQIIFFYAVSFAEVTSRPHLVAKRHLLRIRNKLFSQNEYKTDQKQDLYTHSDHKQTESTFFNKFN